MNHEDRTQVVQSPYLERLLTLWAEQDKNLDTYVICLDANWTWAFREQLNAFSYLVKATSYSSPDDLDRVVKNEELHNTLLSIPCSLRPKGDLINLYYREKEIWHNRSSETPEVEYLLPQQKPSLLGLDKHSQDNLLNSVNLTKL